MSTLTDSTQKNGRLTVSVSEAAQILGISKNLAYDLARRGELPGAIKLGQKRIVVSRIQIENLIIGAKGRDDSEDERGASSKAA